MDDAQNLQGLSYQVYLIIIVKLFPIRLINSSSDISTILHQTASCYAVRISEIPGDLNV